MVKDISESSTFLRYHEIYRSNPTSVIFAPLAEMLILHKRYEEAITVCKKGLEKNPDLVSGRLALARAYCGVKNYKRAKEEATKVTGVIPGHPEAIEIIGVSEHHWNWQEVEASEKPGKPIEDLLKPSKLNPSGDERWNTVTMAELFAAQGKSSKAKEIFKNVLRKDPDNNRAIDGLAKLGR